ncbi:MAG: hypothetical protein AB9891_06280 [Anaerolineaceae bacterium]
MTKASKFFSITLIGFSLIACNLGGIVQINEAAPTAEPATPASETPPVIEPSPTATTAADAAQTSVVLEPCTLVTLAEAEAILAEQAGAPQTINGACAYNNAKDSLYMVSVAAAQDQETVGILQGQTMLVGFAGGKLDEARMEKIKAMSAALDYKGVFSELITAAEGLPTLQVRLVDDDKNDLVYWVWITAQTRRQGGYVAVRGQTLVNINLVVADSQSEESMLAASNSLAEKVFERLPEKFSLSMATPEPAQNMPDATPTIVPSPTWVGLAAPGLVSPADGAKLSVYPRLTTLVWSAVPGASKYVVEIVGCNLSNPSECFTHPMYENTSRETVTTDYSFKFMGDQPGKWRVWAVGSDGLEGQKSQWWNFTYAK